MSTIIIIGPKPPPPPPGSTAAATENEYAEARALIDEAEAAGDRVRIVKDE